MSFYITTDATCDMPKKIQADKLYIIPMVYNLSGKEYGIEETLSSEEFYKIVKNGAMPSTTLINQYFAEEQLGKILQDGHDLIHLSFSSGLSGSYENVAKAVDELKVKYPERKIYVIDSLCACLGEALYVYHAINYRNSGKSIEETYEHLENFKQNVCHYFTVDDLNHLQRGGRVSKAAAFFGGLLNIKPVLYCNKEGKLVPIDKVKGRKKSLTELVAHMGEKMWDADKQEGVFIGHANAYDDAVYVASKIMDKFGVAKEKIFIDDIGPVIGSHSGPGTIALFFLGTDRIEPKDTSITK